MKLSYRLHKNSQKTKAPKHNYDEYSEENEDYYDHKTKIISKDKKSKSRYQNLDTNSEENNLKKFSTTARQKTIWGSKAYQSNRYSYKNKNYSERYSENSYNSRNESKDMKKIKKVLKFLIEFKKFRNREVEGKYFDIWYDKTYNYYDTTYKDDYKEKSSFYSHKFNYETKNKKYHKKNDSFQMNANSKNKSKNNSKRRTSDKDDYFYTDTSLSNKDIYYLTFNDMKYNYKNKNKNSIKLNNDKDQLKSKKVNIKKNNECFSEEYVNDKKTKINNSKSKRKNSKKFNKKLLFILQKYMIEGKEDIRYSMWCPTS